MWGLLCQVNLVHICVNRLCIIGASGVFLDGLFDPGLCFLLADVLNFLLEEADLLTHLQNKSDACGIDPFIGQRSDLFQGRDILIGVEAVFAILASWLQQSSFLIAA